jgi:hypothetical protein
MLGDAAPLYERIVLFFIPAERLLTRNTFHHPCNIFTQLFSNGSCNRLFNVAIRLRLDAEESKPIYTALSNAS